MAKNLLETYRQIQEGILPDLKKPGIGPGSGQHSVGNMSVRSVSPAEAHKNLQSPSNAVNNLGIPRLNNIAKSAPAAPAPKPAAKPTPAPQAKSSNAAIGSANPTDTQRRAGMSITATRNQAYGKGWTPAAKAGPTPNTGASGAGPVPNAERPRAPLRDSGIRRPISGTNNVQTRLAQMRKSPPALDTQRNKALDNPTKDSPMAKAVDAKMAADAAKRAKISGGGSGQAQAATTPKPAATTQKPAAATPVPKPTAKPAQQKQSFSQAFAAARKKAGGGSGVFTWNGKQYQTNVKGEKYQKISKLKKVQEQSHEETLGALEVRRKGEQQSRRPSDYRVTVENNNGKRKVRINFEPENKYFAY